MAGRSHAKRIRDALDDLQRSRAPTDRLDAARRAREAAEALERANVEAAREAGLAWADIGDLYGMTKQGAQQRFRNGAARPRPKKGKG